MELAYEPEAKPPFLKRLQERMAASRFFTFSLLIHVVLIVMAGSVVLFKHYADAPDFSAGGSDGLLSPDVEAAPPAPDEAQPQMTPATPEVNAPQVSAITANTSNATPFQMAQVVPVIKAPAAAMNNDLSKIVQAAANKGAGNVPSAMGGRMGGMARSSAMMKTGGKEASERAVIAGLNWLKAHQNEDGSWGVGFKPAMTGLAVLSFLGHGELLESPDYGPTVSKAVDWLIARGAEFQGRMSLTKDGWGDGNQGAYQHAICTYAMGEYYSMTKDDRMKDVLTQAVKYVVEGQNEDGGWKYSYAKGGPSDTSVTGWQVQALKAAHLTGLQIPGVDESLDKSMLYFKDAQAEDGSFGYHGKAEGNGYSLAGVGTLCVYFWKQDKDKLVHDGIKCIIEKTKKDWPVSYKSDKGDLYAWYYDTQACLMFGGDAWSRWNRWFQDEIDNNQNKDGSWPPLVNNKSPGGDLQKAAGDDGPYFRTTLCILMLEVYYRYMPINK